MVVLMPARTARVSPVDWQLEVMVAKPTSTRHVRVAVVAVQAGLVAVVAAQLLMPIQTPGVAVVAVQAIS